MIIIENELLTTVITCHAQRGKLVSSPAERKQRYQEKNTSFLIHRLITDWSRVDTSCADSEAGSSLRFANAARTEYLAFSHTSRSCSGMITSGKSSSRKTWQSVVQDSSRVPNPEVVVSSKYRAFLYAALNFRKPAHLCQK